MEKNLQKWADSHLPNKSSEDLWDLQAAILTELSRRDGVSFRTKATDESVKNKIETLL